MDKTGHPPETMDEYFRSFPREIQDILQELRDGIRAEVPDGQEGIRYGMPTFRLNGKNLVHFAAWKTHIGFYPTPSGTENFKQDLKPYKLSKGSIRFPIDQPLPMRLIREIVRFRVEESLEQAKKK